ncbi:C5a anaphylatoxin chemotactic receptor 1-like [Gastrophryne carolinensis]
MTVRLFYIKTAFLNGDIEEELYMTQLEGCIKKGKEHLVCKMQNLYARKEILQAKTIISPLCGAMIGTVLNCFPFPHNNQRYGHSLSTMDIEDTLESESEQRLQGLVVLVIRLLGLLSCLIMNDSYDSTEYPDYDLGSLTPLSPAVPPDHRISPYGWVAIIMYGVVFLVGVPGNSLVVWVTTFEMKRTVNSVWFVNLAVADLLCCFFSPFSIMTIALGYWPLGLFACKVIPSILMINLFASVLILTVISIDRCALVLKPVWCQNNRTVTKAYLACLVVWILALVLSSPALIFRTTILKKGGRERCAYPHDSEDDQGQKVENAVAVFRFILGFLIPFVIITVCYSVLITKVRGRFSQSLTKTLKVVIIVIIGFFICWFPYHVAGLILATNPPSSALFKSTNKVDIIFIAIAFTNSCINPIIYVLVGQQLKTKFKRSLRFILKNVLAEETSQSMDSRKTKSTTETKNTEALV